MTDIPDRRQLIQEEEVEFDAAVSESVGFRLGALNNFIANRILTQHDWNLNGPYNIVASPQLGVDGFITFPWPYEIVYCILKAGSAVGSGVRVGCE